MKREDIFSKLFEFSIPTFYNWQREKRPIITLLDKYFSKEELEEFLEYGTIEKLEFTNFQNYIHKQSQFIVLLNELAYYLEVEGRDEFIHYHIDYMAFAFSKLDTKNMRNEKKKNDTKKNILPFVLIDIYDHYIDYCSSQIPKFSSSDLRFLMQIFNSFFPKEEGYSNIIAYFIETDFFPLVKACMYDHPDDLNLAIELCIRFNIYKYKSASYEIILEKIKVNIPSIEKDEDIQAIPLMFEKFRSSLQQIMNNPESNSRS